MAARGAGSALLRALRAGAVGAGCSSSGAAAATGGGARDALHSTPAAGRPQQQQQQQQQQQHHQQQQQQQQQHHHQQHHQHQQRRWRASQAAPPETGDKEMVAQAPPAGEGQQAGGSDARAPPGGGDSDWTEVVDQATGAPRPRAPQGTLGGWPPAPTAPAHCTRRARPLRAPHACCARADPRPAPPPRPPLPAARAGRSYWWNESTGETTELDAARPRARFHSSGFAGAGDARFQDGWREPLDADHTFFYSAVGALTGLAAGWATQFFH